MTLDGFLTFLSILLAGYALTNSSTRMRLALLWGWPLITGVVALALVLYLQFFEFIGAPCSLALGNTCHILEFEKFGLTGPQVSFFVVLIWMITIVFLLRRAKVSPSGLKAVARLFSLLLNEGRYREAIDLFAPNVELIDQAVRRKLLWPRLRARIRKLDRQNLDPWDFDPDRSDPHPMVRPFFKVLAMAHRLLPDGRKASDSAYEICRSLSSSNELIALMSRQRPMLCLQLLKVPSYRIETYGQRLYRVWLDDPDSFLFTELDRLEAPRSIEAANFRTGAPLHFELFGNCAESSKHLVWKPIGDEVIRRLTPGQAPDYLKWLNSPPFNYDEDAKLDPFCTSIVFFDSMVRAAAFQGVENHMWLFYFDHFTRRLLAVYDASGPDVRLSNEFAVRADYALYQLFSCMVDWITELPLQLPPNSPHLRTLGANQNQDGRNIPLSAARCLGTSFASLLASDSIRSQFKTYIGEIIFRGLRDIRHDEKLKPLFQRVCEHLVYAGDHRRDTAHIGRLTAVWNSIDYVLREEMDAFVATLNDPAAAGAEV